MFILKLCQKWEESIITCRMTWTLGLAGVNIFAQDNLMFFYKPKYTSTQWDYTVSSNTDAFPEQVPEL